MVGRPDGLTDSSNTCINIQHHIYSNGNDKRMYWNSNSDGNSKSQTNGRSELTNDMLRLNSDLNGHRSDNLYLVRRFNGLTNSNYTCINKHDYLYGNRPVSYT